MSAARPVLFGKLPSHGDFVARNLDPAAREALDGWASAGLERARETLGEAFEAAHDSAPPWRFVSGPGPLGPLWRAGAAAPSIDTAGRRFVIVLAVDALAPGEAAGGGEAIAEAMEGLIYGAFERGLGADAVSAEAAAMLERDKLVKPDQAAPQERWWTLGGPEHAPKALGPDAGDVFLQMLQPDAAGAAV